MSTQMMFELLHMFITRSLAKRAHAPMSILVPPVRLHFMVKPLMSMLIKDTGIWTVLKGTDIRMEIPEYVSPGRHVSEEHARMQSRHLQPFMRIESCY